MTSQVDHGHDHEHEHDLGFAHDIQVMARQAMGRRQALRWFGAGGAAMLVGGCGGGSSTASSGSTGVVVTPTTPAATPTPTPAPTPTPTPTAACTVPASETAGPYPGDGSNSSGGVTSNVLPVSGVVPSDIRPSFIGSTAVAGGVAVTFTIQLVNVNNACAPLAGYAVYLWHCDRDGRYSLYDLPNESYLRGLQVTDANGRVTFTTIFPGCYAGRYPHMHFEIFSSLGNATSGRFAVLTSQFAMPAAVCSAVYAGAAGYTTSQSRFAAVSIASDGIFGDNSSAQMAVMTPTFSGSVAAGYTAATTIGIAT